MSDNDIKKLGIHLNLNSYLVMGLFNVQEEGFIEFLKLDEKDFGTLIYDYETGIRFCSTTDRFEEALEYIKRLFKLVGKKIEPDDLSVGWVLPFGDDPERQKVMDKFGFKQDARFDFIYNNT